MNIVNPCHHFLPIHPKYKYFQKNWSSSFKKFIQGWCQIGWLKFLNGSNESKWPTPHWVHQIVHSSKFVGQNCIQIFRKELFQICNFGLKLTNHSILNQFYNYKYQMAINWFQLPTFHRLNTLKAFKKLNSCEFYFFRENFWIGLNFCGIN